MDFIKRIERVVDSEILSKNMSDISLTGSTEEMLGDVESLLSRPLSEQHKIFLGRWNGANLDFIRIYGAYEVKNPFIRELGEEYREWKEIVDEISSSAILFADDISGFMYFELEDGSIVQLDTDGGDVEEVAEDMSDFFLNYVFGKRAEEYAGKDWFDELREANII